ncbi:MAG: response regulator [Desulfomonile tiedjei]|nr:response regulator [Desulfomonile tiedjei]
MHNQFSLLIADRNRNVRDFLRREFVAEGYSVQLAKDDRELLDLINAGAEPDLLILDLEMPYAPGPDVLAQLQHCSPCLPVVVYTLLTDHAGNEAIQKAAAFLEKRGNNIEDLKAVVVQVLRKRYPGGPGIATRGRETTEEPAEEFHDPASK